VFQSILGSVDGSLSEHVLPLAQRHAQRANQAGQPSATGGIGILVIDDNRLIRRTLEMLAKDEGHAAWFGLNGDHGIEIYKERWKEIDLVLLDVQMPGRDGPATFAELKQINPHMVCCFMTAAPAQYERQRKDCDARRVFEKPFRLEELKGLFQQIACEKEAVGELS
jgi:two-component system OmpR family response regulator